MENSLGSPAVSDSARVDRLAGVNAGQEVYDNHGKKVGKVDSVYAGEWDLRPGAHSPNESTVLPLPLAPNQQSTLAVEPVVPVSASMAVPEFDNFFDPHDPLPKELRARLAHDGFVRIDAGMLHHHRYALRDQVAHVDGGRVVLNVAEDELIKH
jgi:hypothetical protein